MCNTFLRFPRQINKIYSLLPPGDGFVSSECHLQLHVKSHAHAGLMCCVKALCVLQYLISLSPTRYLLLNLGVSIILENFMSFTIIATMISFHLQSLWRRTRMRIKMHSVHGARRETVDTQSGTTVGSSGAQRSSEWKWGRWPSAFDQRKSTLSFGE